MAAVWSAYEYQPSFVLGFHGCDKGVAERILGGDEPHLKHSEQKYDWLGHGIYFWEGNPSRAMKWAKQRKEEGKIKTPFEPIYASAGFRSQNHIQFCVLNTECIKGYFRPLLTEVKGATA